MQSIYINGLGNISIQNTFPEPALEARLNFESNHVRCVEPDFTKYINPVAIRRMSKIVRRAIATAKKSLEEAQIEMPDAIVSGTGLGCIEDTEKFLVSMIRDNEQFLQPTHFIQSTHNTISSQIAILLKCNGYNSTYAHLGLSFDSALYDAFLQFQLGQIKTALVGAYDEMTPAYYELLRKAGSWNGCFAGEGSISIAMSVEKKPSAYCSIQNMVMFSQQPNNAKLEQRVLDFIKASNLTIGEVDAVILSNSGNSENDEVVNSLRKGVFADTAQVTYKNISGEFYSSSAFGFWLAAICLKQQSIPDYLVLKGNVNKPLKNILVHNHSLNRGHSLILLSSC